MAIDAITARRLRELEEQLARLEKALVENARLYAARFNEVVTQANQITDNHNRAWVVVENALNTLVEVARLQATGAPPLEVARLLNSLSDSEPANDEDLPLGG